MNYSEQALTVESPVDEAMKVRASESLRVLHGAMGLSTEVAEFSDSDSKENELEELGDLEWYLNLIKDSLGEEYKNAHVVGDFTDKCDVLSLIFKMVRTSGNILDTVKKHIFYGKELKTRELYSYVNQFEHYLIRLEYVLGFSRENVQRVNLDKLLKKRYKDGYSHDAAINRNLQEEAKALKGNENPSQGS